MLEFWGMWSTRSLPSLPDPLSFNKPLVTVPKAPITIGIIVTFMFHSFFQFPSKFQVHILLTFFQFYSVVIFFIILLISESFTPTLTDSFPLVSQ